MTKNWRPEIKVNGSIIDELSDKIPNDNIAINELLKNSYDARASMIDIKVNSEDKTLSVIDDGCGMGQKEISGLLQIAKSDKHYGQKVDGRYTQGSKGLGFLAAFRFGNRVVWDTFKDGVERTFSLDKKELVKLTEISEAVIDVEEKEVEHADGTIVKCVMEDSDSQRLLRGLNDSRKSSKLLGAFLARTEGSEAAIQVRIFIDDKMQNLSSDDLELSNIKPQFLKAEMTFDSSNPKAYFSTKYQKNAFSQSLDLKDVDGFICKMHLAFYDLSGGKTKNFPALYRTPSGNDQLTPLVYINDNLFNNYSIFDPAVTRYSRSGDMMAQIIGVIRIYSDDSLLQFNSDRSQFAQTELTERIERFLKMANQELQRCAKHHSQYVPLTYAGLGVCENFEVPEGASLEDYAKKSVEDFKYFDDLNISVEGDEITYSLYGTSVVCHNVLPEQNRGNKNQTTRNQTQDNADINTNDSVTKGSHSTKKMVKPRSDKYLIHYFSNNEDPIHTSEHELPYPLNQLSMQINELAKSKKEYRELISCGLRVFFDRETKMIEIRDTNNPIVLRLKRKLASSDKKTLDAKVREVLTFIVNERVNHGQRRVLVLSSVARRIPIQGFTSIKNLFPDSRIKNIADLVEISNVGSHDGGMGINSDAMLESIGDAVSLYSVLVEAFLEEFS